MRSLLNKKIKKLIKSIPHTEHFIKIEKGNWSDQKIKSNEIDPKTIKKIFGRKKEIWISRNQLLSAPHGTKNKIQKIILWGYPTGSRDTAKMLRERTVNEVSKHLAKKHESWKEFLNVKIKGIGKPTLTKLAYFNKINPQGRDALILDSRIIKSKTFWRELAHLKFSGAPFNAAQYGAYLDAMYQTSKKIGCSPDQLEFFLFSLGRSFG